MPVAKLDAFQTIGDPSRRRILMLLSANNLSINSLAAQFDMSHPAVSRHIKILQSAGFIAIEHIDRERRCKLSKKGFEEIRLRLAHFDGFWMPNLKKLEQLLNHRSTNENSEK